MLSTFWRGKFVKRVIGITTNVDQENHVQLNAAYVDAIIKKAGGLPILLPTGIEHDVLQVSALLDGLLLTGGGDIDPTLYGEEPHLKLGSVSPQRDRVEMALVKEMLRLDKPILAICRGLQILNVACGGGMYQDIHTLHDQLAMQHVQKAPRQHASHFVHVEKGTILESIAKRDQFKVNSFHHQAVRHVPKPLIISAVASDGVVEAIESTDHGFVLGVQWHPEELAENEDELSLALFRRFVASCR